MNLFDESTARNLESSSLESNNVASSLETMTPSHDSHTGGSAVIDAPELAQPSPAETTTTTTSAPVAHGQDDHGQDDHGHDEARQTSAPDHGVKSDGVQNDGLQNHDEADASAHEDGSASSDDFAAALHNFENQTEEAVSDDHVIKGTVIKLTATHVVVDIGAKSEGMAPLAEILDHEGNPKFKPGDEIDVMREKGEAEEGYVNLSHLKAQRLRAWDDIEKAYNDKKPIKGIVVERIKGGLTIDINGAHAFLPGSQVDLRPIRNLDGMKGQTMEVAIIKLNKKRGNIVVSRKQLLEEEQNEKRGKTLEHLEEGSILTGIVKNLTEYGAFVDMGGIDGLLHITDMSWGRLTHPRDLVNVGDQIQVKVLKYDKDKQRVSLGFKQLTPDPWLDAEASLSRGRARSWTRHQRHRLRSVRRTRAGH